MSFAGNKQNRKHLTTQQSSLISLRGSWADKQKTHPITHFQEQPVKPMDNIQNRQTTLEYVNRQLQFECKSLKEALQTLEDKQAKQQSWRHKKLNESHQKVQQLSHKMELITQELAMKNTKIVKIEQELQKFQQSAEKYKQELQSLQKTNQNSQQQLESLKIKKNQQEQENSHLRAEISQTKTELAHQKCQNATQKQQHTNNLQRLQLQNDSLKNKITKIQAQLTVKDSKSSSEYTILKQQYDRMCFTLTTKETEYSQKIKIIEKSSSSKATERLRQMEDKYHEQLEEYREEVRLIRIKYEEGRNQMQKQINELLKIVQNLQYRNRELESQNMQYVVKIEGLQQTISIRNEQLNMVKDAIRTRVEDRLERADHWKDKRQGSLQPSIKLKTETSSPNLTKRECYVHRADGCLRQRMLERKPRRSLPHHTSHTIIKQAIPMATRQQETINEAILRRCRLIIGEHYH